MGGLGEVTPTMGRIGTFEKEFRGFFLGFKNESC